MRTLNALFLALATSGSQVRLGRAMVGVLTAALIAGCATSPSGGRAPAVQKSVLAGTLVWRPQGALSGKAVVKVWLQDMSDPRSPVPVILDEYAKTPPGQVPVRFSLRYDPEQIRAEREYTVLAKVYDGDRVRLVNRRRFPVLTKGCKGDCEIALDWMN